MMKRKGSELLQGGEGSEGSVVREGQEEGE